MEKKDIIRQQIREGALELFIQQHYTFPSMRELSTYCHIPLSSLYSYYKNKQALFEELIGPLFLHSEELLSIIRAAEFKDGTIPESFLETLIAALTAFVHEHHQAALLTLARDKNSIFAKRPEHLVNRLANIGWNIINKQKAVAGPHKENMTKSLHVLSAAVGEGFASVFKQYDNKPWVEHSIRRLVLLFYKGIEDIARSYS